MSSVFQSQSLKTRATGAKVGGKFGSDRVGFIHSKEPVREFTAPITAISPSCHTFTALRSTDCPSAGGTGKKTTAAS